MESHYLHGVRRFLWDYCFLQLPGVLAHRVGVPQEVVQRATAGILEIRRVFQQKPYICKLPVAALIGGDHGEEVRAVVYPPNQPFHGVIRRKRPECAYIL